MKTFLYLTGLLFLFQNTQAQSVPVFRALAEEEANYLRTLNNPPGEVIPEEGWYNGVTVHGFSATSQLPDFRYTSYGPSEAHDFDVSTAWIEGAEGQGIGERLTYVFDMRDVPKPERGITHLLIANGYQKTQPLWQEHSRVKRLRVYINEILHCEVELLDVITFQRVRIGKLLLPEKDILNLSFEIMEVYPGDEHQYSAISELIIDGVGIH